MPGIGIFGHVGVGDEEHALRKYEQRHRRAIHELVTHTDDVAQVTEMVLVTALHAADQRVRVAAPHHQGRQRGIACQHHRVRVGRRHAFACHDPVVVFRVALQVGAVARIEHIEILAHADARAE